MKRKLIASLLYGVTTACLGAFFESLYSGEPIIRHLLLIRIATAGPILFAVATLVCLWSLRFGSICGLFASALSWCYFNIELLAVPWHDLIWFARFRTEVLGTILALTTSTVYSLVLLPMILVRNRTIAKV